MRAGQPDGLDKPSRDKRTHREQLMCRDFLNKADDDGGEYLAPVPHSGAVLPIPLIQIADNRIVVWAASELVQQPSRYNSFGG